MYPNNKMKTRSQNLYNIVRRVGKQETRPPKESGEEKCTTGSATSLEKHSDGNHAQGDLPASPPRVTPTKKQEKGKGQKQSGQDYK